MRASVGWWITAVLVCVAVLLAEAAGTNKAPQSAQCDVPFQKK